MLKLGTFPIVFFAAATLAAAAAVAQGTPADESAIKAIVQSQADAWNRGDAPGFAARYAENGSFTNVIGQQIYGKPEFVAQHQLIFTTHLQRQPQLLPSRKGHISEAGYRRGEC